VRLFVKWLKLRVLVEEGNCESPRT